MVKINRRAHGESGEDTESQSARLFTKRRMPSFNTGTWKLIKRPTPQPVSLR